jgi:hypothetical protein
MSRFIIMSKFNFLVVGLLVGSSLTALSQPSFAQSSFGGGDSRDPFSSASQGDSTGLLRLLNGIQNGKQTSEKDFLSQKQTQLSGSAEDFRSQQLRRINEKKKQPQQLKK